MSDYTWRRMAPAKRFATSPKYHHEVPDWIRSGKALCGKDMRGAGWESCGPPEHMRCKVCERKLVEAKG